MSLEESYGDADRDIVLACVVRRSGCRQFAIGKHALSARRHRLRTNCLQLTIRTHGPR